MFRFRISRYRMIIVRFRHIHWHRFMTLDMVMQHVRHVGVLAFVE